VTYINNTYKHVRVIGEGYDLAFAVWCTMDHELYDMKVRRQPQSYPICNHTSIRDAGLTFAK
jgi:hypothetical protein